MKNEYIISEDEKLPIEFTAFDIERLQQYVVGEKENYKIVLNVKEANEFLKSELNYKELVTVYLYCIKKVPFPIVGKILKVTGQRARQINSSAIKRLKHPYVSKELYTKKI